MMGLELVRDSHTYNQILRNMCYHLRFILFTNLTQFRIPFLRLQIFEWLEGLCYNLCNLKEKPYKFTTSQAVTAGNVIAARD